MSAKDADISRLTHASQSPDFWLDTQKARAATQELTAAKELLAAWQSPKRLLDDVTATLELLAAGDDPELEAEAERALAQAATELEQLELQRMLSGPHDRNGAIISINAGAGGTESCDWAAILFRMYQRWANNRGYRSEIVDFTDGDGAGYRSVTMTVDGPFAYGYLRAEIGVHRLVRISPFDANKRRHTSFCSVYVLPDIEDDIVIDVKDADLKIDTFRAGGAGGQHVNKTDSAVRITHLPTGIVVACQNERSQHKNKALGMKLLKAKLYEREMEKRRAEQAVAEASKSENAWGSQIRSYVLQPYQLIKDHRTGHETGNVNPVLDGETLEPFMRAWLLHGPQMAAGSALPDVDT